MPEKWKMIIEPLKIKGAFMLRQERHCDERGFFARQFCMHELKAAGIDFEIKQCNVSLNLRKGTLRGLHYQKDPYPEIKLVSCMRGRIYDVLVDIRPESDTYLKWFANELSFENGVTMYIPAGVAHGFMALEDDSIVYYQVGEYFQAECYGGLRWNDPKLNIEWPDCDALIINERDAGYELL